MKAHGLWQALVSLPLLGYRAAKWGYWRGNWMGNYLARPSFDRRILESSGPVDVIVVIVDHFEPQESSGDQAAVDAVISWCERYERLALQFGDADGRPPQHTWFYRAEYPNFGCVQVLSDFTFRGLGEVEFHLHHGHDSEESFAAKIRAGLDFFNRAGAMITAEARPQRRFGYIAGNWALDNGAGDDATSGCNTELKVLRDAGCYADFTFPALGSRAQPHKTNSIYYATDDPRPKSYNDGVDAEVGRPGSGDLLIFQGPMGVNWRAGTFEWSALENYAPPAPDRLDGWLDAHVHVNGRPEWVFVKLHTHGMQSEGAFLGRPLESCLERMVETWNRPPCRLHFATAREAFNMVKAAEAGFQGNPNDFRNYAVAPPANRLIRCDSSWQLLGFEQGRIRLKCFDQKPTTIEFAAGPVESLRGIVDELDYIHDGTEVKELRSNTPGKLQTRRRNAAGANGGAGAKPMVKANELLGT